MIKLVHYKMRRNSPTPGTAYRIIRKSLGEIHQRGSQRTCWEQQGPVHRLGELGLPSSTPAYQEIQTLLVSAENVEMNRAGSQTGPTRSAFPWQNLESLDLNSLRRAVTTAGEHLQFNSALP